MGNGEITISVKLHMIINEINTTLLLECHYQSLLSVCNNFWLWSNVDFGEMMRQKYVVSNILEYFFCGRYTVKTSVGREEKVM